MQENAELKMTVFILHPVNLRSIHIPWKLSHPCPGWLNPSSLAHPTSGQASKLSGHTSSHGYGSSSAKSEIQTSGLSTHMKYFMHAEAGILAKSPGTTAISSSDTHKGVALLSSFSSSLSSSVSSEESLFNHLNQCQRKELLVCTGLEHAHWSGH